MRVIPSLSSGEANINCISTPESDLPSRQESKFSNENLANEFLVNIKHPVCAGRLIPMKYLPVEEIDENFDEQAWIKKLYSPDIIVASTFGLPQGRILVDGCSCY